MRGIRTTTGPAARRQESVALRALALGLLVLALASSGPARSAAPGWRPAPGAPADLGPAQRPQLVLLTAEWCHWCHVFEARVLRSPTVRQAIGRQTIALVADVDRQPAWLDLPGVTGLPTLVLFDRRARRVWLRSGAIPTDLLLELLRVSTRGAQAADRPPIPWPVRGPTAASARRQLAALEEAIFLRINDHDGGFGTPARHPHPALLWALVRWHAVGGPARALRWVDLTLTSALRGESPRLAGRSVDPSLDGRTLRAASLDLAAGGQHWPALARRLPGADAYRGLQDPVDHGLYRYAEGPGWYHPHFERLAADNLAWIAVARARGRASDARSIERFVRGTLLQPDGTIAAHQRSDPFYARATAAERRLMPDPKVTALRTTHDQARAALIWPSGCGPLIEGFAGRWPATVWGEPGLDDPAPPDAVGDLLRALAHCPGGRVPASALARIVVARWRAGGLPGPWAASRLHPLVDGICAASTSHCGPALAALGELPFDVRHPPPLAALQRWIRRVESSTEETSDE